MVLFDLTDQVRDVIQQTVHKNLVERGGVFRLSAGTHSSQTGAIGVLR